ncbi:YqhG family protein [Bacillus sp. 2205SS5-2]|uniref:YqhG family protein n=1 Tax=Bacillus sp. 2205SS5-2 TaxID=3109031 RepID=UPI0030066F13
MQQQEIHQFLEKYFIQNGCEILENATGHLHIQLTIDLDKKLMNRPFYWHYLEKTGGEPNPMKLTLVTDPKKTPDSIKGEVLHFGSPRLHQIFQSTKELSAYIRLYEHTHPNGNQRPLFPWLSLNMKVSYQCDLKKDTLRSFGLNLINGKLDTHFHEKLLYKQWTPKIPDYCFTLTPIIQPKSGISRIENFIKTELQNEDHQWAEDARKRWDADLALLHSFYEDMDEKPESFIVEKKALQDQYEPSIEVEIINGGLFYLH